MSERDTELENFLQHAASPSLGKGFLNDVMGDVYEEAWLSETLSGAVYRSFGPHFSEAVIERLSKHAPQDDGFFSAKSVAVLAKMSTRIAIPVATVTAIAVVLNIHAAPPGASLIDTLLGLHAAENLTLTIMSSGGG